MQSVVCNYSSFDSNVTRPSQDMRNVFGGRRYMVPKQL
jgi:hypothetical protein